MNEQWEEGGDIDQKYKKWEKQINSLMYKCFTKVTIKNNTKNQDTKNLINMKRKLNQEIANIQAKHLISNVVVEHLRERKAELIEEITNKIYSRRAKQNKSKLDSVARKEIKEDIWEIRKKNLSKDTIKHTVNNKDGLILTKKEDIIHRYEEYYKELFTNRPTHEDYKDHQQIIDENFNHRMMITEYDGMPINRKFNLRELHNVIKTMKTGRAPGPDNITYEILKNAGIGLQENILKMMNYFWMNEKIPSKLKCLYIKFMYKGKGPISELENQRGIFLGSNIVKTYEKLCMNRMNPELNVNGYTKFQCGGRKEMSPTDQVFTLRSAIEYMHYMGRNYFVEFCDLKKAFDKMILKNVMDDLWRSNVRGRIWRNVFNINQSTDIIIKTPYGESQKINVQQILKQESVLASSLAALHTDSSNAYIKNDVGIWYGNLNIHNLLFQDDIACIEMSAENLNKTNKALEVFQNMNGMLFHELKTVYISNTGKSKITINEKELSQKKYVRYLGEIITDDNKHDANIEDRKSSVNGIVAEIRAIMNETHEDLEIIAAKQYHEGIILSKLLYNCESWINLTKKNIEDLEKIQNNVIKRLLRIPFSTPSLGLLHELNIPTISTVINQRKLMYFHKLHQNEQSLAFQVLKQQESLTSNHFLQEIHNLMAKYEIPSSIQDIKKMSKEKWKGIVKKAVYRIDKEEKERWCMNSSKCKNLGTSAQHRSYIDMIDNTSAKIILMEKLNMTEVKDNYKGNYTQSSLNCNICNEETETTLHLLNCKYLGRTTPEIITYYNLLKNQTVLLPDDLTLLAKTIAQKLLNRDKLQNTAASKTSVDEDIH